MTPTLNLHLLGPWQAELNGKPLPALPTRHARALLARLALAHPCPMPRGQLVVDLFSDKVPDGASQHLRTTLFYLRRVLGVYLGSTREDVSLHAALHIHHDVGQFEAAAQGLTEAALGTAMRLYRGPFLDNTAEGWGACESRRLQRLYVDVLRRAVAVAHAEGRPETARDAAQRWASQEPWEEQAHVALISALLAGGDRGGAEAKIAQARAQLRASTTPSPGAAFEALVREIARLPATIQTTSQALRSHPNEPRIAEQPVFVERGADASKRMEHNAGTGAALEALAEALATGGQALRDGRLTDVARALEVAERAAAIFDLAPNDPRRWPLLLLKESYQATAERGATWSETLTALAALATANRRGDWQVEALTRQGRAQRERGQPPAAEASLRRAGILAMEAGSPVAEAIARYNLAAVLDDRGAVEEALAESEIAVRASLQAQDEELHVRTQGTLAYMQMRSGRVAEAETLLTTLLDSPTVALRPALHARLARQLGIAHMAARHYEAGLALLRESVRRAQVANDMQGMLICQTSLCYELTNFGLYQESLPLAIATIGVARQLGARTQESALLNLLARAYYQSGDGTAARARADESATIAEALQLPEYAAESLNMITILALVAGRLEEAITTITRAEQLLAGRGTTMLTVHHTAARVWLAAGQHPRARERACASIRHAVDQGLAAIAAIDVLWEAAEVIAILDGPRAADPVRQRAYARLLDDTSRLVAPSMRRAFLSATKAHRAAAAWNGTGPQRLVWLPLPNAPTGRPLYPDEQVPVVWTLHDPDDPWATIARRRRQLQRLTSEAIAQGAVATVQALAGALEVSTRTVLRDLQALAVLGDVLLTRGNPQNR